MKKLFYVRIDIIDLMDFATDPEGENMSLLTFAKELKKEQSQYPQIQRMINEAHCYMRQKKEAGIKSAEKRAAKAKKEKEEAEKAAKNKVNGVGTEVNGVGTEVNGPSTNNRSSTINILTTHPRDNVDIGESVYPGMVRTFMKDNGDVINADTGEILEYGEQGGEDASPF
jgi:hypothetical protein